MRAGSLVQEYGIARTTAAKVLRVLVDEGLAEVVPGWGTYVIDRTLRSDVEAVRPASREGG